MQLRANAAAGLRSARPVMAVLCASLITAASLAYGPGLLATKAAAQTRERPAAPAPAVTAPAPVAATPAAPVPAAPSSRLQIIAHEAGDDWGPRNTLPTIAHDVAIGTDGIEFDVHFTADHQPVVFHDETLGPTTSCKGDIDEISAAKLAKCRVGAVADQVPSLDAVLTALAATPLKLYVHLKGVDTAAEGRAIMAAINRHGLNTPDRLTVIASDPKELDRVQAAGAKRLGLVFDSAAGWHAPYKVLVAYGTKVTPALVADAQRRGHFVIVVQGAAGPLNAVPGMGLNGYMADSLTAALRDLHDVPAPVSDEATPREPVAARPVGGRSTNGA
jgi:glycerophosphoryl diester phosphodiesterase